MLSWLHDIGNQVGYSPNKVQAAVIIWIAFCLALCIVGSLTAAVGYGGLPWRRRP